MIEGMPGELRTQPRSHGSHLREPFTLLDLLLGIVLGLALAMILAWRHRAGSPPSSQLAISYPDEIVAPDFPPSPAFAWWNNTAKYPPLGYFALLLFYEPGVDQPYGSARLVPLFVAWTAFMVFALAARSLTGSRVAGACAAVLLAGTHIVLFYAGTLHLEIFYLAWIVAALAVLALARDRACGVWPCLLAVVFLATAVLTKDQAYPLAVPLLAWGWHRSRRMGWSQAAGLAGGASISLASALGLYAWAAGGLPGRTMADAMRAHVSWLLSEGTEPYRAHAATPSGWTELITEGAGVLFESAHPILVFAVLLLVGWGALQWSRGDARHAPAVLAFLALVSYVVLFLLPIGFVYHRFWVPVWPALLLAAIAEAHRLLRGRPLLSLLAVALALTAASVSIFGVVRHLQNDPRHRLVAEIHRLGLADEREPLVLPVVSRSFGARYLPGDDVWRQVPAVRDWSRQRFGRPAGENLAQAGLLPHPYDIALYLPPFFVARADEVPVERAARWGYAKMARIDNESAHPALPRPLYLHVFARTETARERSLAAARESPLSRQEAWLVASSLVLPLTPSNDPEAAEAFFLRFAELWMTAATGDPDAPSPDTLGRHREEAVRDLLRRAARLRDGGVEPAI